MCPLDSSLQSFASKNIEIPIVGISYIPKYKGLLQRKVAIISHIFRGNKEKENNLKEKKYYFAFLVIKFVVI